MGNWNMPPGCSDWQIPGNEPDPKMDIPVSVKDARNTIPTCSCGWPKSPCSRTQTDCRRIAP